MAPRATSKAKNHKSKGEKKKKEDKLLPAVLDILVNLPSGEEVILKGISTDRILDVRKLLAVNVETCHLTRFSLSHQVRGDNLSDSQEVIHLKPCMLTLREEAYTEDEAIAHVRRLLDIISCTTSFGPSGKALEPQDTSSILDNTKENSTPGTEAGTLQDFSDIARLCPPSKLGKFYEFFSFAHLKAPIQAIRKLPVEQGSKDFFSLEVKVSNGKLFTVSSCVGGFHHAGKQSVRSHSLADLLRHLSKAFDDAYDELLKGFGERNKFANLPYNLRANTWLVPPVAAESPSVFPLLPAEDEAWNGNGGGRGREPGCLERPWARLFELVARLPCGTPEERELRDHKAFILHNYFVDVATTHAVEVIRELDSRRASSAPLVFSGGEHVETRGSLRFTVTLDSVDPCEKAHWKIESCSSGSREGSVSERNLLKGITADESTVVHDVRSLGVVLVRHQGYKAAVEALVTEKEVHSFDIPEPAEGGANALNANSLRTLLHKKAPVRAADEENAAGDIVQKLLNDGIEKLSSKQELAGTREFLRWELGACWIQHLGEKKKDKTSSKESNEEKLSSSEASPLKDVLSEAGLKRLRETGAGLHLKVVPELLSDAHKFYDDVALPKLVTDFAALELSPVEGRTLTDFMHIRGLRISSLGHLAELCAKLPHIRLLCIHEMVIRALKHFVRAAVASVRDASEIAQTLATALNSIFGAREAPASENRMWKWLTLFLKARYGWGLSQDFWFHLRKYAVLRGLCYKVGIEMVSRDYDFESHAPFTKADVISLVPVYKHAICSSADGRTLLESSKTALDKGKLEDAVSYGSKALAKLIAVCGPFHRMTAGAYSLLAVVLYHTGDFVQAMTYQQKALDINERELGLDHPDTMKSYGDLAVFYYRLQHTELALRYVNRALYLLHLICGPSHPNTAATYINVAMMEEALGNAHVALRYLHEALKCNERLLGKDHIQTAASYHAIAIALSLMEAYSLSVHHEQTTFQILQAKLGPDDIRTQDAAAWLEYFDSKAVEQQEAARTGAPKPDPNVASKGHLSVSDLLEYINAAEVAETNSDKGVKKVKRLKILSREEEVKNAMADLRRGGEALSGSKQQAARGGPELGVVQETKSSTLQQPKHPELNRSSALKPEQESKMTRNDRSHDDRYMGSNYVATGGVLETEDEGWLEASSRGKNHRRQHHRFHQGAGATSRKAQVSSPSDPALSITRSNNIGTGSFKEKEEKDEAAPQVKAPAPPPAPVAVTPGGDQARSYRDVALMSRSSNPLSVRRPPPSPAQAPAPVPSVEKPKLESTGATQKSDAEDDTISQASSTSQAGGAPLAAPGASPRAGGVSPTGGPGGNPTPTIAAVTPLKPSTSTGSGKPQQAGEAPPRPPPAAAVAITTTVAVTPIRKQVLQLPQKTSNAAQVSTPRSPAPASSPPASPANAPASAAASGVLRVNPVGVPVAGSKKPMNPFAIEFVPGRKWHPLSPTSETNSLQTTGGTGSSDDEKKQEEKEAALKAVPDEPAPEPEPEPHTDNESQQQDQEHPDPTEQVVLELDDNEAPTPEPEDQLLDDEEELQKPVDQPPEKQIHTSDYYSSDSNWTEEKSDSSEGGTPAAPETPGHFRPVMRRSTGSRSRSKSRWQRRSDGAITRVYRIQGDKSSVNPQLRTTSTFTDVPEPHTIQPASIMRRSVRVS